MADAPPPRTNLAALPTRFVGRSRALEMLGESLERSRLVTVLGPPGTGKTRLVKEYALGLLDKCETPVGGIFFCDLSEASTLEAVLSRLAPLIGLSLAESLPLDMASKRVEEALSSRGASLIILDNFEQLVASASSAVSGFLTSAAAARFLITSRERLSVAGEAVFDLGPLSLPPEGAASEHASEAVELFIDRARSAVSSFSPKDTELDDIRDLVRLLDGLPLAIELAAARTRILTPRELIERLGSRFALLTRDASTLRSGRGTLWETIEASWELLSVAERLALSKVATCRGGFDVRAAESLLGPAALDLLQSLRDKSLVLLADERGPSSSRFTLLASIREFGEAKIDPPALAEVHAAHARHFLQLGEELGDRIDERDDADARLRLRLERENFMAVHQRFLAPGSAPADLRGAALRAALILARSASAYPYSFCLSVLDAALASEGDLEPALVARALEARGNVRRFVGMTDESIRDFERVLALAARPPIDRSLQARALSGLGNAATVRAKWRDARELFEKSLAIHVDEGDRRAEGRVLAMLAATRFNEDEPRDARTLLTKAIEITRVNGDRTFEAISVTSMGIVMLALGALSEARTHLTEALAIHRQLGMRHWEGVTLAYAAQVEHDAGRSDSALAIYREAMTLLHEIDVRRAEGLAIAGEANVLLSEDRPAEARERYKRSLDLVRTMSPDHEGLVFGCLGCVAALEGDVVTADDLFSCAEISLRSHRRPSFSAAVAVHRGQLELAEAGRLEREGAAAEVREALVQAARARLDTPWGALSADVRFAQRLLARSLERLAQSEPADPKRTLYIGPEGLWFRPPRAKESIRLHRRRSLQRLVDELVERRLRAPGEAVRDPELVARGWPGEKVLPDAGTERVYTAIATLRRLGLKKLLLQRDDGYLLDPMVGVVRSEKSS